MSASADTSGGQVTSQADQHRQPTADPVLAGGSTAADVVKAYFACVAAGNAEAVASLFADEAVLVNAAGTLVGAEAIRRMYQNGLQPGAMRPSPRKMVVDGTKVAVEIDLDARGQSVTLADFFTVVNGRIQRLAIYSLTPTDGRLFDKVGRDPKAP